MPYPLGHSPQDSTCSLPWEDIFKLSSFANSEFCKWVQDGIDVYISHWKCQVKCLSTPWFSAASATVIVHWNHFFRFYNGTNLNLKQSSDSLVIIGNYAKLLIVFLTKANLLYLLYSTAQRCCLLHQKK